MVGRWADVRIAGGGLNGLTPGDFAVAARQFELWNVPANPDLLLKLLRKECESKGSVSGWIGFEVLRNEDVIREGS